MRALPTGRRRRSGPARPKHVVGGLRKREGLNETAAAHTGDWLHTDGDHAHRTSTNKTRAKTHQQQVVVAVYLNRRPSLEPEEAASKHAPAKSDYCFPINMARLVVVFVCLFVCFVGSRGIGTRPVNGSWGAVNVTRAGGDLSHDLRCVVQRKQRKTDPLLAAASNTRTRRGTTTQTSKLARTGTSS